MSDNKKYYYLKIKENFYETEEMIILQNMQDGYLYSDILMKLYLRSLKTNGKLMFKDVIPYTPEVLAQVVRHQVGTVKQALQIFQQLGLIEILDNGAIYMLDIQNFIGQSSTTGDRLRKYRDKIKQEKQGVQMIYQMNDKRTPEIEIEIDIEKDIDNTNTINSRYIENSDVDEKSEGVSVSAKSTSYNFIDLCLLLDKYKVNDNDTRTKFTEYADSGMRIEVLENAIRIPIDRNLYIEGGWDKENECFRIKNELAYTLQVLENWKNFNVKTLDDVKKYNKINTGQEVL